MRGGRFKNQVTVGRDWKGWGELWCGEMWHGKGVAKCDVVSDDLVRCGVVAAWTSSEKRANVGVLVSFFKRNGLRNEKNEMKNENIETCTDCVRGFPGDRRDTTAPPWRIGIRKQPNRVKPSQIESNSVKPTKMCSLNLKPFVQISTLSMAISFHIVRKRVLSTRV